MGRRFDLGLHGSPAPDATFDGARIRPRTMPNGWKNVLRLLFEVAFLGGAIYLAIFYHGTGG